MFAIDVNEVKDLRSELLYLHDQQKCTCRSVADSEDVCHHVSRCICDQVTDINENCIKNKARRPEH